ncbi:RagB/SusD family nutrient uptake outer membrane protein [Sphingobacterium alkalisoli]|uniref:RagB/SusD family nutrient uptake outer membrane protein n=1 Tax=Sphingobacterium alkalisoli TaxID=1874115 RepID=A0A4U0H4R0_9SPHI|nr:RagB/SusD family nutrient uptake outer membrane protein [Sphingobacterium alkalisoli]TJY66588.1 RagB/SusD family nutrient uptake outer membrane protein [Sphingobacterium alkalisoli]GGH15478.1 membrane protein [Sphingobacterium alkalisoli]
MRNYYNKTLLFTLCIMLTSFGLSSCKKYLDKAPNSDIETEEVFKNFRNFQGFTEELYNSIPLVSASEYHNNWNYGEEEYWEIGETRLMANAVDQGDSWGWNTRYYSWFKTGGSASSTSRFEKGKLWGLSWYAIRKANVGIANLDLMVDATQEEKNLIAGQLYFFRAWFHFMLMQYWGGLPYIDSALPTDEVIEVPRLNYRETAEKVAADFQKAAELLPIDWDATTAGKQTLGNNNFRINKIMALAYAGKNYLWAGSPLMNQESTGASGYNTEYCKKAADAFAEALNLTESTNRYELASFSQYTQIFYTYNQSGKIPGLKEAIFVENLIESGARWRWNQVNDYRPPTINASGIKVYPTANYVDYYGMSNGLPLPADITQADPESGFDPQYPWKDRDPRFYHDIIIDGEKCVSRAGSVGNDEYRQYASLFTGGLYRTANPAKAVLTGYMNSKFTNKLVNDYDGYQDNNVFVLSFMRLADVYLMYAEATSIGYGSPQGKAATYNLTAADAVNKVRERAGIDPVHSKFLGSTDAFLHEVRRERAVELAFEGHRFIDLRRWLLLTEQPYTLKKAVQFDRGMSNDDVYADPKNARVLNFRETVLVERKLEQKHYWFPFLQSDVTMYEGFQQNPGW